LPVCLERGRRACSFASALGEEKAVKKDKKVFGFIGKVSDLCTPLPTAGWQQGKEAVKTATQQVLNDQKK